jgi:hypothetical protein
MFTWKRLGLSSASFAFAIALSLAVPSTSFAHDPMFPKLGFHFRLGLGGDLEGHTGSSAAQRRAMDPSIGGGVELEVPVTTHFSLGGAFEAYGWTVGGASDRYGVSLDLLFMPRFRIPFGDHPWHAEVYLGIPIGPTLSLPHEQFAVAVGAGPLSQGFGVTGGGRLGVRLNAGDVVGFFIDVGPMFQYVSFQTRSGGPSFDAWNYQFVMRIGASFGLGA